MIIDRMPLGKPYIIEDYANGPNGNGPVCYIYYGPDHERWETSDGYYFGDYEERFTSYNSTQHTSYTYLDGGVLFLLYEMITRRKPSEKFMIRAEYIGFGILILLMVVANLNDILRWLGYM